MPIPKRPGVPTSFRLSPEAGRMLKELESHLGQKRTAVVELAVRKLYRAEGLDAEKKSRKKSREGA